MADTHTQHWHVAPYFIVDDVMKTANWYRDELGFTYERFWSDPPSFCMVKRAGVIIMLGQLDDAGHMRPNNTVDPKEGVWDAYLWIDDADALLAEYRARGVPIARDICDQVYQMRDFDVVDCNGYRLCFGHDIS